MVAVLCAAAFGTAPAASIRAQDLQDTLGRILQGFQGQDQRYDPRSGPQRHEDGRRTVYSERWSVRDRLHALDEADRRLDAQQRRLDEDRRRIEAERRRLTR